MTDAPAKLAAHGDRLALGQLSVLWVVIIEEAEEAFDFERGLLVVAVQNDESPTAPAVALGILWTLACDYLGRVKLTLAGRIQNNWPTAQKSARATIGLSSPVTR